jgi:ATP-binding protein involved in chromosome partitioning
LKSGITEKAFSALAEAVARQVAIRNAEKNKTEVVQVN